MGQGFYIEPTIFQGTDNMEDLPRRNFSAEYFSNHFKDFDEAIKIANDTIYGLGAGVWSRSAHTSYRAGRQFKQAVYGQIAYHIYPAHAAFGGYKKSGIGRENHRMMLGSLSTNQELTGEAIQPNLLASST